MITRAKSKRKRGRGKNKFEGKTKKQKKSAFQVFVEDSMDEPFQGFNYFKQLLKEKAIELGFSDITATVDLEKAWQIFLKKMGKIKMYLPSKKNGIVKNLPKKSSMEKKGRKKISKKMVETIKDNFEEIIGEEAIKKCKLIKDVDEGIISQEDRQQALEVINNSNSKIIGKRYSSISHEKKTFSQCSDSIGDIDSDSDYLKNFEDYEPKKDYDEYATKQGKKDLDYDEKYAKTKEKKDDEYVTKQGKKDFYYDGYHTERQEKKKEKIIGVPMNFFHSNTPVQQNLDKEEIMKKDVTKKKYYYNHDEISPSKKPLHHNYNQQEIVNKLREVNLKFKKKYKYNMDEISSIEGEYYEKINQLESINIDRKIQPHEKMRKKIEIGRNYLNNCESNLIQREYEILIEKARLSYSKKIQESLKKEQVIVENRVLNGYSSYLPQQPQQEQYFQPQQPQYYYHQQPQHYHQPQQPQHYYHQPQQPQHYYHHQQPHYHQPQHYHQQKPYL